MSLVARTAAMCDQFPKRCRCCGASHDATSWALLPLVGVQRIDDETIELRNCSCSSTLGIELEPERFAVVVPHRAHQAAWLVVHRDQLASMRRVTAPAPVHPAVALFAAARARAMGPRERIQPGRVVEVRP